MMKISLGFANQVLIRDGIGDVKWTNYPFIAEFDDAWSHKYSAKCERLCVRFASELGGAESNYGSIYKLSELLWKLKVWKP